MLTMRFLLTLSLILWPWMQEITGHYNKGVTGHSFGRSFNGSTDALSSNTTVNFSSTSVLSVWININQASGGITDSMCMESSANVNSNTGAFFIDCHAGFGTSRMAFDFNNGTNVFACQPTSSTDVPNIGVWVTILFVVNVGVNPNTCLYYLEGASKPVTLTNSTTATGTFATYTVNIAARNPGGSGSLWENASFSEIAIWKADESANVTALGNGTLPSSIDPGNLVRYVHICGTASPEPDQVSGSWTVIGTPTQVTGPGVINCP